MQHLEEYAATLAKNMELTYLNPVGLVTPNISTWQEGIGDWARAQAGSPRSRELLTELPRREVSLAPQCFAEGLCSGPDSEGEMWEGENAEGGTPTPAWEKSVSSFFSSAVLSIDRMEHPNPTRGTRRYPRYHSNLFRGQDAWDPHTHVLLPPQSPQPYSSQGEVPCHSSQFSPCQPFLHL